MNTTAPTHPALAEDFISTLRLLHRDLRQQLFRTLELALLVEHGEHHHIGKALDDIEAARRAVGRTEALRASLTEALVGSIPGEEPSVTDVLAVVDGANADRIRGLVAEIEALALEIAELQLRSGEVATQRRSHAGRTLANAQNGSTTYGRP